jgi:hypothetical protein
LDRIKWLISKKRVLSQLDFMSNMPAEILIEIFKSSFIPIEDRMPSFDNCIEPWSKLYRHYQRTNSYRDVVLKDAHSLHLFMRSIGQDSIVQDAADIDNKLANLGSLVRVLTIKLRKEEKEEGVENQGSHVRRWMRVTNHSANNVDAAPSILDSELHHFVGLTQLSLGGTTTISATFFTTLFAVTQLATLSIADIELEKALDDLIDSITMAKCFRHLHLNTHAPRMLVFNGFGHPVPDRQGRPICHPPHWPTKDHVERLKAIGDRKGIRLSGFCFDIEYW